MGREVLEEIGPTEVEVDCTTSSILARPSESPFAAGRHFGPSACPFGNGQGGRLLASWAPRRQGPTQGLRDLFVSR